jgi:transposase
MTNHDFRAYLSLCKERGLPEWRVAQMLGCGRNSITTWKHNGAPTYIALAIAALEGGLNPWVSK